MNKTLNTLLVISSIGLAVAALIFILVAMSEKSESNGTLFAGLFCVALSNLFNLIRSLFKNK